MEVRAISKKIFDQTMINHEINDENVENRIEECFISIVDTDQFSKSRVPYFKFNHSNVLNLAFDDCEHDGEPSPTQPNGTKAFSKEQAEQLYEFIKINKDRKVCLVHCMAGISRSGAVSSFINGITGGDWQWFKRMNPQIVPNGRVLRLLNQVKYNDLK